MTTLHFIGIAVAVLAGLLFVAALVVTRKRGDETPPTDAQDPGSFLDQAPQDTFSTLGRPDLPVEDVTLDPALERAAAELRDADAAAADGQRPQPGGLGLEWGPDLSVRTLDHDVVARGADDPLAAGGEPAAGAAAAERPGSEERLVPLSDIIVTTNTKLIDLDDPEVRRMLTELVTFEIDQAAELRRRGQTVDALLQLAEAEKISRALGMTESARRIRAMTEQIRASG